jgi:peroxiredoxin
MTTKQTTPHFRAAASTGQILSSESFRGKVPLAMIFFPDGHTGVLAGYNSAHTDLAKRRVQLLGVVTATASDARQLADLEQLTYPLLADPAQTIFREFGAINGSDEPTGCSLIIDKTGTVAWMTEGVVSPAEMTTKLDDLEESSRFEMAVNR